MILLLDNYDSFAHNLARYLTRLGQETVVVRNDAIDVAAVRAMRPDAIVLSPGPCTPNEAGISLELIRTLHPEMPILGICLGHQAIAVALGGQVIRAPQPVHGRTSLVLHDNRGIFANLPNPLTVCRYHSLIVDESSLPSELHASARSEDGVIMAVEHRQFPVVGLQFHPESILTDCGYHLLEAFLRRAGLQCYPCMPTIADERLEVATDTFTWSDRPVTF
ncbi:MAG: aminodeoxychorismate/anthranilate synthase component II [Pirellulales bacterium]|nr:aminodeoxychorismate/anthranilate synthase component II [Pirellulales bacterium]